MGFYFTNLSLNWKPISEQGADLRYLKLKSLRLESPLNNSMDININNKYHFSITLSIPK